MFLQVGFLSYDTILQQCVHLYNVGIDVLRQCNKRTGNHRHRFQQRADVYSKSNYHTTRQRSRIQQHKKSENKKVNKRIKLSAEEAERFGTVIGAAWKAAY